MSIAELPQTGSGQYQKKPLTKAEKQRRMRAFQKAKLIRAQSDTLAQKEQQQATELLKHLTTSSNTTP